jgi:hypothetical protein
LITQPILNFTGEEQSMSNRPRGFRLVRALTALCLATVLLASTAAESSAAGKQDCSKAGWDNVGWDNVGWDNVGWDGATTTCKPVKRGRK